MEIERNNALEFDRIINYLTQTGPDLDDYGENNFVNDLSMLEENESEDWEESIADEINLRYDQKGYLNHPEDYGNELPLSILRKQLEKANSEGIFNRLASAISKKLFLGIIDCLENEGTERQNDFDFDGIHALFGKKNDEDEEVEEFGNNGTLTYQYNSNDTKHEVEEKKGSFENRHKVLKKVKDFTKLDSEFFSDPQEKGSILRSLHPQAKPKVKKVIPSTGTAVMNFQFSANVNHPQREEESVPCYFSAQFMIFNGPRESKVVLNKFIVDPLSPEFGSNSFINGRESQIKMKYSVEEVERFKESILFAEL